MNGEMVKKSLENVAKLKFGGINVTRQRWFDGNVKTAGQSGGMLAVIRFRVLHLPISHMEV
jgi:hypothetical protein